MKFFILLFAALMIHAYASAQVQNISQCDRLIREAEDFLTHQDYANSIIKYESAKRCDPKRASQIDDRILKVKFAQEEANSIKKTDTIAPRKRSSDSHETNDTSNKRFVKENSGWLKKLSSSERALVLTDAARLNKQKRKGAIDSIEVFFKLLDKAKTYYKTFAVYAEANVAVFREPKLLVDQDSAINFYGLKVVDYLFLNGWKKAELSMLSLPADVKERYQSSAKYVFKVMEAKRRATVKGYWFPDTLFALPVKTLFHHQCADNKNFAWAYSNTGDYRKLDLHFLNLSLTDFSVTKDSIVELKDSGYFYTVTAIAPNYRYQLARPVKYSLENNKTEYRQLDFAEPFEKKLVDGNGHFLFDLSTYSSDSHFFSPDAQYVATWDKGSQLVVVDVKNKKRVELPDSDPAPTESFSTNSKTIAYYNKNNRFIYFADLEGNVRMKIPSEQTGIYHIDNIDFTGDNKFLKINNVDSICLFDIERRRTVMRFKKRFVDEIVVAPNGKDILLICNTTYEISKTYAGNLALLVDADLNIKARLYSQCSNFFFTPDGEHIIGYDETSIMRWRIDGDKEAPILKSALNVNEMLEYNCLPPTLWMGLNDAELVEMGARGFKDIAAGEADKKLSMFYYKQSKAIWERLIMGTAKNIRRERIPFFYDWSNWIDRAMERDNYHEQFIRQVTAVNVFDRLVSSPDSIYPQQVFYAANANMLLGNLYDNLKLYNEDFIEQIKKEISLRQRVFECDPDNTDNIEHYTKALVRLSAVYDTVGWRRLMNGQYIERLSLYREEEDFITKKMKALPDSFNLQNHYINMVTQLGASFLYIWASHAEGQEHALDKAIEYADKGLTLGPDKFDSARLLLVKARAYLLQPGGLANSMALYRQVLNKFPFFTRETMLKQLQLLADAGARREGQLAGVEALLKQKAK